jgi:OOP family OmpA-OmpF porin
VGREPVAAVLPEAIGDSTARRERDLALALEPTVTRAVTDVAGRHPEIYAEALAPTIGAAVKKAVADAIAAMLERLNEALERSLSATGVRWRLEAARTGRPFAEVVLLRTLVYRVEQVFLIHTRTSLVLEHVVHPGLGPQAPDQVAAMLSAIDAFGREAFGPLPPTAHLSKFEIGDLAVWIARDPDVTLAAAVRGSHAQAAEIGVRLGEALARVHVACQVAIREFSGDVARFAPSRAELEPLLTSARRPPPERARLVIGVAAVLLVATVAGLVGCRRARDVASARREHEYVAALASEPGIVVTGATFEGGRERISGLRDPIAAAPEAVVARRGLSPATFAFVPFASLDPRIVEQRARRALEPPATVELTVREGTLRMTGTAPRAWASDARRLGRAITGIERVDDGALRPQESLDVLRAASSELEAVVIPFHKSETAVPPDAAGTLDDVSAIVRNALRAGDEAHLGACLQIVGSADKAGTDEANALLSLHRAVAVATRLKELGVDDQFMRPTGAGADGRTVTLRLVVDEAPSRRGCGGGA